MSTTLPSIVTEVKTALETLANPERLPFAAKVYPTNLKVLGLTVPDIQSVMKELKKETTHWPIEEKIDLAIAINEQGIFEMQHLALEYLGADKKVLRALRPAHFTHLMQDFDNWVSVDVMGMKVLGMSWSYEQVDLDYILSLTKSKSLWIRRLALSATVGLNLPARGGKGDEKQTLAVCERLVHDTEEMVVKALSWALRELVKHKPDAVAEFIAKHEDHLAKRVLREVRQTLARPVKNKKA
ncbi:DNA alkylation repair protein [Cytophagales bacterium LB-30]|uniref:DNA alkylation repair protein n=1 Tax=Shiella aurantiaca TaxID=3058365 RepID=A0ABT8F345_9BACT|nr:DNA alkylation repair protein [Shiella aurantiaca]MDN4164798.1 DNA alkylation repair protein [Shiella aurantiaca]